MPSRLRRLQDDAVIGSTAFSKAHKHTEEIAIHWNTSPEINQPQQFSWFYSKGKSLIVKFQPIKDRCVLGIRKYSRAYQFPEADRIVLHVNAPMIWGDAVNVLARS